MPSSTTKRRSPAKPPTLNLTTPGEDDDGHAAMPTANITAVQAGAITVLLARCSEKTRDWFVGEYGSVECVHKARHDILTAQLNKAIKAAEAANENRN